MKTQVIHSSKDFAIWCRTLKPIFALDLEGTSLKYLEFEMTGFSICDGSQACYVYLDTSDALDIINTLHYIIIEAKLIIFHNSPFDMMMLKKYEIDVSCTIFDTLTASHLADENRNENGLKALARDILGIPEGEIKKYTEVKEGTPEFEQYALNDAIWTYQLFKKFSPQIENQGLHKLMYDIEMPFQHALVELNINGIGVDKDKAKEMYFECRHLFYTIENDLLRLFGGCYNVWITPRSRKLHCEPSINFNSSDQVVPLVESLGFEIYETSDKGRKSWGKTTKKRLEGQHPAIDLLIKYSKVEKLLNGFLKKFNSFVDIDGRIRSSFNNTVCVTGRLSSSNPNVEQLPNNNEISNIRNLFVAKPDHSFIVADYSSQELRILGVVSRDRELRKAFEEGLDLHQITADATEVSRKVAKSINFGIAYGEGAFGFSKDFNCSEAEAQKIINKFFFKYPAVKTRIENCHKQVYNQGYVTNMAGRRRRFPDFRKKNKWGKARCYRQSFNFLIQSYGAEVIRVASANVIKDKLLKLCNIVHDELVIECPDNYLEQGVAYVKKCMLSALPMFIPWEATIDTAKSYGETKK